MSGSKGALNTKGDALEPKSLSYCDWQSVWIMVSNYSPPLHWGLTLLFLFWSDCKQIMLHIIHLHLVSAYVPVSTSGSNIYPVTLPPTQHHHFLLLLYRVSTFTASFIRPNGEQTLFPPIHSNLLYKVKDVPPSYRVQLTSIFPCM